jgi:hypothetical protein
LHLLGQVALDDGDAEHARPLFLESLSVYRSFGWVPGVAACLEGLAHVAVMQGQPQRAARLLGAAAAQRRLLDTPLLRPERERVERAAAETRAALADDAFAAAWSAGESLSLEQAVAEAMEAWP